MPTATLVLASEGYSEVKGVDAEDEAEARRLLAKSGHPEGSGLPPIVIMVPEAADPARVAAVRVEVRQVPAADYFDQVRAGPAKSGYTLASTTWIGDFADPVAFLGMWTAESNLNDARLADPEYDRLVAAAEAKEEQARLKALAEAETRLLAGAAVLPLYHSPAINVVDIDLVQGWHMNALDIHPFKYLSFGIRKAGMGVVLLSHGTIATVGPTDVAIPGADRASGP
jgi:oligopeptide transport system substrate-binding protein